MIPDWLKKPETILCIVLFFLSLFGPEIRRGMLAPPRKFGQWFHQWSLNFFKNKLALLKILHGDPYRLFLWTVFTILDFCYTFIGILMVAWIIFLIIYLVTKKEQFLIPFDIPRLLLCGLMGRLVFMHQVFKDLWTYENSVKKLEKFIIELESDKK